MKRLILIITLSIILSAFTSCKKESDPIDERGFFAIKTMLEKHYNPDGSISSELLYTFSYDQQWRVTQYIAGSKTATITYPSASKIIVQEDNTTTYTFNLTARLVSSENMVINNINLKTTNFAYEGPGYLKTISTTGLVESTLNFTWGNGHFTKYEQTGFMPSTSLLTYNQTAPLNISNIDLSLHTTTEQGLPLSALNITGIRSVTLPSNVVMALGSQNINNNYFYIKDAIGRTTQIIIESEDVKTVSYNFTYCL